jgi:hypothetical protein
MKFLVPNYSCLQNLWLGGHCPQIPVLPVLNWICWTPSRIKFLGTPLSFTVAWTCHEIWIEHTNAPSIYVTKVTVSYLKNSDRSAILFIRMLLCTSVTFARLFFGAVDVSNVLPQKLWGISWRWLGGPRLCHPLRLLRLQTSGPTIGLCNELCRAKKRMGHFKQRKRLFPSGNVVNLPRVLCSFRVCYLKIKD